MSQGPYRSIPQMLRESADRYADRPALSRKVDGAYVTLTYAELYERVLMAARGLLAAGLQAGDRVAILSENRTGWAIADLATQVVHGVTVPVYPTSTTEQTEYILNHSGARFLFVSSSVQYEKVLSCRDRLDRLELACSFDRFAGRPELPLTHLHDLSERQRPLTPEERQRFDASIAALQSQDLLTIIYTSGTTGRPKGVMLNHGNVLCNVVNGIRALNTPIDGDTFLSFLPLSHVLERTAGYYVPLMTGSHIAYAESVEKVVENIGEICPTIMVSVPRLFEKIYSRIHENVHHMPALKKRLFHWSLRVGRRYADKRFNQKRTPGLAALKYWIADRLVFGKIRQRFGGRLRFCASGGAPLDKKINEFMWTIGIPTFEGYGLTESSPALTLSGFGSMRYGSVGPLLPQTEARILADGELIVRGPQVMQGYYNDPIASRETLVDGWLYTGDIARIDADGYVYIVDRKKEIIVTSGGKNIAPQPLENELKLDKYISQGFVYGDRKPYLVALITPNLERLIEFARHENLQYVDLDDLVMHRRVQALYAERIALLNRRLPSFETIKRFALIPRDFSVEGGELTPTLKLRRKVIVDLYHDRIEQLYASAEN